MILPMNVSNPPEHNCPDCEEHPPLVYRNSVGPGGAVDPGQRLRGEPPFHFFKCPMCGRSYMATSGGTGPLLTPPNQVKAPPTMECFNCGSERMRVRMVETHLEWHCEECGHQDKFSAEDIFI